MANYPVSLDTITNPTSGNTLDNPSHSLQHSDANDILEALETKLGIGASPAGSATSGYALVASTGGTTSWTTIGTAGISSGTATSGQILTANGSGGVSFGNGGLTLINTTSFSAVASHSVNDVFSTNYKNYKILVNLDSANSVDAFNLRLRVSGSDNSNSEYRWAGIERSSANTTVSGTSGNGVTSFRIATYGQQTGGFEVFMYDPFTTQYTGFCSSSSTADNTNSRAFHWTSGGAMTVTTSYTGFTIIPQGVSITMTGSVRVYGVNQ